MSNEKYNWELIKKICLEDGPFISKAALATYLGIPYNSVFGAFKRGDLPMAVIDPPSTDSNEKTIRMLTGSAVDLDDVLKAYEIDTEKWAVSHFTVGSREFLKMSEDDSAPEKRWNWLVKLRRRHLPLSFEIPRPVVIEGFKIDATQKPRKEKSIVLFITDQHFGYKGDKSTCDVEFLKACWRWAKKIGVDIVVWGGDLIDFPTFSTFTNDPAYTGHAQRALNDAASWLAAFAELGVQQFYLKGNHEERIDRMLKKFLPSAYGLTRANDPQNIPVLSMQNLLNLDQLGVVYIDDWKTGDVVIDGVRYTHGTKASEKPGATVGAVAAEATTSTIFGHVHRSEIIEKKLKDSGKTIFVGTPGMGCELTVPGADARSNWQAGAYVITNGNYPERIHRNEAGDVVFRGMKFDE